MFDAQSQQYLLAPTGKKGESENLKKKIKKLNVKLGGVDLSACFYQTSTLLGSNQSWQIY